MTLAPPTPGQEDWADDLNAYLLDLEERIATNFARIDELEEQVIELQAKPERVYDSFAWSYNVGAPPAASGQVRLDTDDPTTATLMNFRKVDVDGADRTLVFQRLDVGALINIQDWDDADSAHHFEVTGKATIDDTYAEVPVAWRSGNGVLPSGGQSAKVGVSFLVTLVV